MKKEATNGHAKTQEREYETLDLKGQVEAINRSQAVIEFETDGTILWANDNFLDVVGYELDEVQGEHHSIFVDEAYARSPEYKAFWKALGRGEYHTDEFKRFGKGGKEVWIQASYNPILDEDDEVVKVVKFATDVTEQKRRNADYQGQIEAVNRAQAVIEFNLDGTIRSANDNFLSAMGYTLEEVQGEHHSIFVSDEYARSAEYKRHWADLNDGEFISGEFKRFDKEGEEVWIQATYNPIFDTDGELLKVVKFATDVTEEKLQNADYEGQIEAIGKAQAVIEFDLDGTIRDANDNFLDVVGYELDEVQGEHHSIFVDEAYARSGEYKEFWAALSRGEHFSDEFKRLGKGGEEVWIQATYNPIIDMNGEPFKVVKFATDVTEEKLQNAEYEGKVDAIGKAQAVIEFEMDGTILTANDNFLDVVGYTLNEVQGEHHRMFVEEELAESQEYKAFWEALGRGEFQSGEFKRFDKEGEEVWIQATYNPIMDMNGEPFKVVKFATDVTEEVKKREQFRLLSLVANETDNSVIITDAAGLIEYSNPGFTELSGYTAEESLGKKPGDLLQGPDTDPETVKRIREKLDAEEPFYEQILNYDKEGNSYWISLAINPVFDENGKLDRFVSIQANVTKERQRAGDYEGQIEAINRAQGMIEFEMDGTIRTANDNFLDVVGYTLDEVQGEHHSMFVEDEHARSPEYKRFWEALNRGEARTGEFKRIGKGGEEVWIQATYNPILDLVTGEPYKVVKFATDVTEQVKSNIRLQESVDAMLETVNAASEGDLTHEIAVEGDDAIGQMAEGLRQFLAHLRQSISQIGENAEQLAAASEEMSSTSETMGATAEETSAQANVVASAAEQVDKNVQTVATGAEEMEASIKEVAGNASQAASIATEAVDAAEKTNVTVGKLGESSAEIGNVIKVITSIAQQTNLLALNATIEAARAGEAGKGFAVVANEVKELAKQTAQATEDISQKIEAIQADTGDAVEAIGQIGEIIGEINGIQSTIASAVEEQTATTGEIARNVGEAAKGSAEIAENIAGVAKAAEDTTSGASESQKASAELAHMAATLQEVVGQFRYE